MILLADLNLTDCTEALETVSINNSKALRRTEEKSTDSSFITKYANRPRDSMSENMSLHEYFMEFKNQHSQRSKRKGNKFAIPNFVGMSGAPVFPVTDSYARHVLIVHRPWRKYPANLEWTEEFNRFIHCKECPKPAKIPYLRAMTRYYDQLTGYEPKSSVADHSRNPISEEDSELLILVGLSGSDSDVKDRGLIECLHKGTTHKWDSPPKVRSAFKC